ncbi:glycosyltransferase family 2 protein [Marinigracilibium pacificum]|uniref:Glycosyltransferase family 2 protein n=1 Tax=Marinigracilibium pacificum TaxID=2729599 RepID=A0A848J3Q2_9BACT|nr:glycosyltransferase family 2 protein [Marinigracilibium pacificum]NMM49160.1 glycosyltransferase family 2 protein [Marinigracilibium pacificum]
MKKTAIAILNYNGLQHLKNYLPGVINESSDIADIYLIENAGTDESIVWVRKNHPEVKIIILDKNYGFAGGYNEGLKQINNEYLLLLNSDIRVTHNWLEPLVIHLDSHPNTASVQPKIRSANEPDHFEYAGAAGGMIDKLGYPFCRGRIFNNIEKDTGKYDNPIKVFWTSGACMLIQRELFIKAGGFPDDFFAHMEEIDLCWRLQKLGYDLYCIPDSTVYHVGGGTLQKQSPFKTYLNFRNNLRMIIRNYPGKSWLGIFITRLILDGPAAIKLSFDNGFQHLWAVIRAHFKVYSEFSKLLVQRKDIKSITKQNEMHGFLNSSLILEHYIKGKNTFEELETKINTK